jgi:error-prone DNA polymerase
MVPSTVVEPEEETGARRVLVHSTGFKLSPYADITPTDGAVKHPPRKLWHASGGSSG